MLMKDLKLLAASLLLCSAVTSYADGYRRVEIKEFNGTVTSVDLSDNLRTEFNEGKVLFIDDDLSLEFDRYSVRAFSFSDVPTGIESVNGETSSPKIEQGKMSFSNLPEGSRIMVVSASGSIVSDVKTEGNYSFNINELPAGVYVVNVNGLSYKVIVK